MEDDDDADWERLPTHAFGRIYTHIPEHVRQDLETLDRERATYSDLWIDEIGDFRHVRTRFTDSEAKEFARRSWAYELFLRAGCPAAARDVPEIDQDVAADADSYELTLKDGRVLSGPYHCFAAFLGSHLEELVCAIVPDRQQVIDLHGREALLFEIRRVIETLTPTIRSFNSRERGLHPWPVRREDDVRDLLYVMLRPIIFDLIKEEAIPSRAGTHKFVDLCSSAVRVLIEVKWIGEPRRWKRIVEQIHIDIQSYIAHPACETLVFVIVDAARDVPDPRRLEASLSGTQTIDGRTVNVRVHVAEP